MEAITFHSEYPCGSSEYQKEYRAFIKEYRPEVYSRRKKQAEIRNRRLYKKKRKNLEEYLVMRLNAVKTGATKRGLGFSITIDDVLTLWERQKGRCYYTHRKMTQLQNSHDTFSIDRIDNTKGYFLENIVLCCNIVNTMKNDLTVEDFLMYVQSIYKRSHEIIENKKPDGTLKFYLP